MPDRLLLVDVGNSRIKWVRARAGAIEPASAGQGDVRELAEHLASLGDTCFDEARIACVAAEERALAVEGLCREAGAGAVRRLETRDGQGGVRCAYADPNRLGVDRWLALIGAATHHGTPVIAWDLGTATTLDAVGPDGRHLGGWILPGPGTMQRSLGANTRLPVPGEAPEAGALEPGRDTSAAIRRGILAAQLGALDRFLAAVRDASEVVPRVVVTGGAAGLVLEHAGSTGFIHDPWLVFRGMLID